MASSLLLVKPRDSKLRLSMLGQEQACRHCTDRLTLILDRIDVHLLKPPSLMVPEAVEKFNRAYDM